MNANVVDIGAKASGGWTQSNGARLEFRPKYAVTRAALSPDGRLVAFADKLGSVFVLQLDDNRFQLSAALHSPVTCLAFVDSDAEDVDCDLIVTTVDSNAIHFLKLCPNSLRSRRVVRIDGGHKSSINDVSFDGKHRMMTSSAYDSSAIWSVLSFLRLNALDDRKCQKSVFCGHHVIISAYRDAVFVLDSHTFAVLRKLESRQLLEVRHDFFVTKDRDKRREKHVISAEKTIESFPERDRKTQPLAESETLLAESDALFVALSAKSHLIVVRVNRRPNTRREKPAEEDNASQSVQSIAEELLRKYAKFPQKYRIFIWTQLLALPRDRRFFHAIDALSAALRPEVREALKDCHFVDSAVGDSLVELLAQLFQWRPELLNDSLAADLALFCFPVYLVTAFCLESREALLRLRTRPEIKAYFRSQHSIAAKVVTSSAYSLALQYVPLNAHQFTTPLFPS
ncbi:unnamed protein product [Oppiella nova]|uniref:Uncharacterized protein n=2 Tax=Oppiella nova TaxID=334625 RepID=A0A7R9M762_9ACAR|nr:unnamed protein product [Oppiella nova]CAG2172038.1 unnamed protein product [Oppiella nova]